MPIDPIGSFGIYGKTLPEFDPGFLHYERLEAQLPFHNWVAAPHRHAELDQFLFFAAGRGRLILETETHDFTAPVLLFMPAGTVHGFQDISRDIATPIVTIAQNFMDLALVGMEASLLAAIRQPQMIFLQQSPREMADLQAAFGIIAREYSTRDPGRQGVMAACLRLIVTTMGRIVSDQALQQEGVASHIALFSEFRDLMEAEFRNQPKISYLAQRLGTSVGRLNAACHSVAGKSPQKVLHERLITEAKRMLLYTSHPATTLSYMLGFREPAYFSRFFSRAVGMPPGEFRNKLRKT